MKTFILLCLCLAAASATLAPLKKVSQRIPNKYIIKIKVRSLTWWILKEGMLLVIVKDQYPHLVFPNKCSNLYLGSIQLRSCKLKMKGKNALVANNVVL